MYAIILIGILLPSALAKGSIEDNKAGSDFFGTYKLVYVWPKIDKTVKNCLEAVFSEAVDLLDDPFTCECERKSPNLAFLHQKVHNYNTVVLADIVKNPEELSRALKDTCHCKPLDKTRSIFMKVNANYFLYYDLESKVMRTYLFSKAMPVEAELKKIIENFGDLKDSDGMPVCKADIKLMT